MTTRREILLLAAASLAPAMARSQPARKPLKLAWFTGSTPEDEREYLEAFKKGMGERGYVEGRDFVMAYHRRSETIKPFGWMARDIAGSKPDVILATCEVTAEAAKGASSAIPIVLTAASDPVANKLVSSLAHPGGNITGMSMSLADVTVKRLELLKQLAPKAERIAVLGWKYELVSEGEMKLLDSTAGKLGMSLIQYKPDDESDFRKAFVEMEKAKVGGLIDLAALGIAFPYQTVVPELCLKHRIPAVYLLREIVERGGLVSYGPSIADGFRRSAHFVDRLARGAKVGDLPIEQPSVFETCVNLKTAKAMGIRIPETILFAASRVIE